MGSLLFMELIMKHKIIALAAILTVSLTSIAPAQAQFWGVPYYGGWYGGWGYGGYGYGAAAVGAGAVVAAAVVVEVDVAVVGVVHHRLTCVADVLAC